MSAILMSLMYTVGASGFYARFDALNGEFKRVSLGLAESCTNVALLAIATSTDPEHYDPVDQVVNVGTDSNGRALTCTITGVDGYGTTVRTVHASSDYMGAYSQVATAATVVDPTASQAPHGRSLGRCTLSSVQYGIAPPPDDARAVSSARAVGWHP